MDSLGGSEAKPVEHATAYLIYLRSGPLLLSKQPYSDWREIQAEYDDYMASLGPWTEANIIEHFALDYGDEDALWPFPKSAIVLYMRSSNPAVLQSTA
jgi:hypothetical protein